MVDIHLIPDSELEAILKTCAFGGCAYLCAAEELEFRARHPEYRVAG